MLTTFCFLLTFFAADLTAEQIADKHLEAIGGDKWKTVKTMRITGDYEAFSETHPFVIYRKRPAHYRFEHRMLEFNVVRAFNGKQTWWINPMWRQMEPGPIPEPQNRVTLRESVLGSPLMGWRDRGHTLTLLGTHDVEGEDHYKIEIQFKNGPKETWFINTKTFLKTLVQGETYEYGRPMPLEEFFGEYQEVEGVMIPFYIEQEWHTRHRVYTVEKVEINTQIDDALFAFTAKEDSEL
jgi:hypothetical protein